MRERIENMSEQNNTLPRMLDARQVMKEYGFSRPLTYKLLNNPAAGAVRIGPRRIYMQRDMLEEWIRQQSEAQRSGRGIDR